MNKNSISIFRAAAAFAVLLSVLITAADHAAARGMAERSRLIDSGQLLKDIEFLSSDAMRGRQTGTPENVKAREFIVSRFDRLGLKKFGTSYVQEFAFERRGQSAKIAGANVIGYIEGKKRPGKYIVLTAHFDHVGERNGEIYNGADDNASGTAALLAMAEAFKKNRPENSIIFAAFDAEEMGLQGARHFVANLPVAKESIRLNINMDMLGRSDKGELYAAGAYHYPHLRPMLETVQKRAKVKLLLGHDDPKLGRDDWTFQSDHGAFHREKIPFIYFGVEDHEDYHKPTDDFENIQPEFYVRAVETVFDAIVKLDGSLK